MKIKKNPMRMCIVTKEKYPKSELIRVVRTPENEIKVDKTGKLNGKGAYLKKDIDPVVSVSLSVLVLKEHMGILGYIGAVLILGAAIMSERE